MQSMGQSARAASALMGKAAPGPKNTALKELARLLRSQTAALQVDNEKDLSAARAAGLAEPMVDRLKLSPAVLETCAQGCEQLAAMPDIIGDIVGMQQQPSGIRVGQMRVPLGVFGMIYESRPNVTIEAASLAIKSASASPANPPPTCHRNSRRVRPHGMMLGMKRDILSFSEIRNINASGRWFVLLGIVDVASLPKITSVFET